MTRETHLADTYHRSIGSNGVAIASNWRLSASGTGLVVWSPESGGGGSLSYGSNATDVGAVNAPGASPLVTRADHVHRGVRTITANSSNSLFGDINLRAGLGIALSVSGNTITISVTGQGGSGVPGGGGTLPTYVANGAMVHSSTVGAGPAVPLPVGHTLNDILVLVCESGAVGVPAPSGWTEMPGSPQISTTGNGTVLSVHWKRHDGSETDPNAEVVTGSNHVVAVCFAIRGCATTGNPWDVTTAGKDDSADTTLTADGLTTTVSQTLVVVLAGNGVDTTTPQFSGWTNASLTNVTERFDEFSTESNGGGVAMATGEKAVAGVVGQTTATMASSAADTWMVIAFKSD